MKMLLLISFFLLVGCEEHTGKAAPEIENKSREKLIIESKALLSAETMNYVKIDHDKRTIEVTEDDQDDISDRLQARDDNFNCKLISHIPNKFDFRFKGHYLTILSGDDQLLFKRMDGIHEEIEGVWENRKVEDGYSVVTRITIEGENFLHMQLTCVPL